MERERKRIQDLEKERLKGTPPPKIETTETFPIEDKPVSRLPGFGEGEKIDIPTSTGGSEIPEQTLKDFILYNKKAPPVEATKKDYKKIALDKIDSETLSDINTIIKDYRDKKTRTELFKKNPAAGISTQPLMTEGDKAELINLVIDKYKEKENKLPTSTEMKVLLPQIEVSGVAKRNNIKFGKSEFIGSFDRTDPEYVDNMRNKNQLKANENNTITTFKGPNEQEFFFPDTIKLKNGSVVNAKKFFIDNLTKKVESGPGRKETLKITLKDKELAKLFNTSLSKIESVSKSIRNSSEFTAEYPLPRPADYYNNLAKERIKKAREYLTKNELTNVKLQENELYDLNKAFKDGTLVVTDYPNLVKALNTTVDKDTGIIDRTIKKTKKEMIERSKDNSGLFDISHTIPRTSEQQNIEFLRNRNLSDYKTNQSLFKSFEAYVRNQTDDPEYDLRLEEFDNYLKEIRQRVKIGNRFFGLDEAMIDSNTGEFLGINKQLEYYGLPKFENGIPLKKVKKALGGIALNDIGMQEYTEDYMI
jgi:hypothetical protein